MHTRWNCLLHPWSRWDLINFYWWPVLRPVFAFKRWAWSRCAGCGGRFPFRSYPDFDGFEDDPDHGGPGWFRGEKKLYHSECHSLLNDKRRAAERDMGYEARD